MLKAKPRIKRVTQVTPVVEILGIPGIGKKAIAQCVASNLGFNYQFLPNFSSTSFTGKILLQTAGQIGLEYEKRWWLNVSAANIQEFAHTIVPPIVISNYKLAFKNLFQDNINNKNFNPTILLNNLPNSTDTFVLLGSSIDYPTKLTPLNALSADKYIRRLKQLSGVTYNKIYWHNEKQATILKNLESVRKEIQQHLVHKYNLEEVNNKQVYDYLNKDTCKLNS